jgi:hypothetical protein
VTLSQSPDELRRSLAGFSGTERYYRTHPGVLATDGAKYLAKQAGAYWLLDIIWSVLPKVTDEFAVLELEVDVKTRRAVVLIHDGREPKTIFHRQEVTYTDFPLEGVKLYIQQNGGERVLMLPSEY